MTAAATTERAGRRPRGIDRVSVMLFSLAAFLAVLAVLVSQLHVQATRPHPRMMVVRRVYLTTTVETVIGARGGGTSVSQSSSSTPLSGAPAVPTTRTS